MFSKSCEYALRAVLYIASNSKNEEKVGLKPIAEKLEIPAHFLGKILQKLAREKIIHSIKGPHGGFYTTEQDLEQKLIVVVDAIDGPDLFCKCAIGLKECSDNKPCPLHSDIGPYRNALRDSLKTKSIRYFAETLNNEGTFLVL